MGRVESDAASLVDIVGISSQNACLSDQDVQWQSNDWQIDVDGEMRERQNPMSHDGEERVSSTGFFPLSDSQ